MADEPVVVPFHVEASGTATEDEALAAFEDLVGLNDSVYGSVVIAGVSHDASEFREEEPVAAPRAPEAKGETKAEVKR